MTVLHGRQPEAVGVGVRRDFRHQADEDFVARPDRADVLGLDAQAVRGRQAKQSDAGNLEAGQCQAFGEFRHGEVQGDVIAKPIQRDFHESGFPILRGSGARRTSE